MFFTFWRNALKLSTDGTHLNFPLLCTLKCQPRKSNPSVVAVSFVFFSLTFIPLTAEKLADSVKYCFCVVSGL